MGGSRAGQSAQWHAGGEYQISASIPKHFIEQERNLISLMFYVYVIFSHDFDRIYIGMTSDLDKRLKEHNSGHSKSTKAFAPWEIVYSESFSSRKEARERENSLKSFRKRKWIRYMLKTWLTKIQ